MTRKCIWDRFIYNGFEPDNRITFNGIETETQGEFKTEGLSFMGRFNDSSMSCSIIKMDDGSYHWIVDEKDGYVDSFEAAWQMMPALLTHPDHFEETEPIVFDDFLQQ